MFNVYVDVDIEKIVVREFRFLEFRFLLQRNVFAFLKKVIK